LPDGIFSNQRAEFGYILEGLATGDVGIFYGHLVYFTAIWSILRPFGICILWPLSIFSGYSVYFSLFGMLHQEKSGNPVSDGF
jgi:hypothetical protein